jgi:hypothetical protein
VSAGAPLSAPYHGLIPYGEEDAPYFFGRDAEREVILANLQASRLTLVYGPSGVGKSSLLRAGVAHYARLLAAQNLAERGEAEPGVIVHNAWRDDPMVSLTGAVQAATAQALTQMNRSAEQPPGRREFIRSLEAWSTQMSGDLFLILDQFEEYLLYHPEDEGDGSFAVEFPRAVNRAGLRASFLVSIREDSLSRLDRFKGRIVNLFDNYLRVEHLNIESARAAIEGPVAEYNRRLPAGSVPVTIDPGLVVAVLGQLQAGHATSAMAGRGGAEPGGLVSSRIETSFLQLVMTRLWDEMVRTGGHVLQVNMLLQLGGADTIMHTHLDTVMSALPPENQQIAARVFHYLVTSTGAKVAHTASDLSDYAGVPEAEVTPVLNQLAVPKFRVLRTVEPPPDRPLATRYEIFHDVLAGPILDWRQRYMQAESRRELEQRLEQQRIEAEKRAAEERQKLELADAKRIAAAERRVSGLLRVVVALLIAGLLMVGAALVYAAAQARAAQRAAADAEARANAFAEQAEQLAAQSTRLAQVVALALTAQGQAPPSTATPTATLQPIVVSPGPSRTPTHTGTPGPSPTSTRTGTPGPSRTPTRTLVPASNPAIATIAALATIAARGTFVFEGQWVHNFGTMTLQQRGASVSGSYFDAFGNNNGAVSGDVTGDVLNGTWSAGNVVFQGVSGIMQAKLDPDGQSFGGMWNKVTPWCGALATAHMPDGCGFAGDWQIRVAGATGRMSLAQTGKDVTGTFFDGSTTAALNGSLQYRDQAIVLAGAWRNADFRGQFTFYMTDAEGSRFSGNSNGSFEFCGARPKTEPPPACLRK